MENIRMDTRLLTVPQVCEYLGCSKAAVYTMCYRGQLPYIKLGNGKNGAIRFDSEKIKALVDSKPHIEALKPVV